MTGWAFRVSHLWKTRGSWEKTPQTQAGARVDTQVWGFRERLGAESETRAQWRAPQALSSSGPFQLCAGSQSTVFARF